MRQPCIMDHAGYFVTRAVGIGPLPRNLEQVAGPVAVERAFREAGLPMEVLETPRATIPMKSMIALYERAGAIAGDPLFGLRAGLGIDIRDYGLITAYALQARTLRGALQRYVAILPVHQTGRRFALAEVGQNARFLYTGADLGLHGQHTDHVLPLMLEAMRAYLGPSWAPQVIELPWPDDGFGPLRAERLGAPGVPVRF